VAELEARCRTLRATGQTVALVDGAFRELRAGDLRTLQQARAEADRLAVAVWPEGETDLVAALGCVDYVCVVPQDEAAALRERLARPLPPEERRIVSRHADRLVYAHGSDRFVKEFVSRRARDAELKRLWKLKAIGIGVPQVLATPGASIVTARLPGEPLDRLIARRWTSLGRRERNRLIERVAALCRRLRDAGHDWPDLVTYHVFVADDRLYVLDPARLRRGRLDLSPLFWSTDEPSVSRADRLRFWRAYAGPRPPPRLRRIGHRGRFRPYRWIHQRIEPRSCPPWAAFVNAVDAPFDSAEEVARRMSVRRTLEDRVNGTLDDLVIKITRDPEEARREWENHRLMMAAGFRVPQPAVGGRLPDGRALFSTLRLADLLPMDEVWATLDPRRAVRAMADLARRLHACGLVHKDLYLNHLFVARGGEAITLVDLGRLTKTTSRRLRRKDLAALLLSAQPFCSRAALMRGLKRYGGDRRLARAVLRKAARMARHVPRRVRDGSHSLAPSPCTSA
jgi:tRNA A-37 threonylcarbamoyl transferase component Bud32